MIRQLKHREPHLTLVNQASPPISVDSPQESRDFIRGESFLVLQDVPQAADIILSMFQEVFMVF